MTTLKGNKRWIYLAVILNLTGCGADSGSDGATSVQNSVTAGVARVELVSDALTVDYNGSITLNWTTSQVQDCVALGDWSGNKIVSGSETVSALTTDSQFTLTCNGSGGTVMKTVNVTVTQIGNGTALFSWMPPTQNTDGSSLTDLAGYKIWYGTSPGNYSDTITLAYSGEVCHPFHVKAAT